MELINLLLIILKVKDISDESLFIKNNAVDKEVGFCDIQTKIKSIQNVTDKI